MGEVGRVLPSEGDEAQVVAFDGCGLRVDAASIRPTVLESVQCQPFRAGPGDGIDRVVGRTVRPGATLVSAHRCPIRPPGHAMVRLCPGRGRPAVGLHDASCCGGPVVVRRRTRVWKCAEDSCRPRPGLRTNSYAAKRSKLTTQSTSWALDALRHQALG